MDRRIGSIGSGMVVVVVVVVMKVRWTPSGAFSPAVDPSPDRAQSPYQSVHFHFLLHYPPELLKLPSVHPIENLLLSFFFFVVVVPSPVFSYQTLGPPSLLLGVPRRDRPFGSFQMGS